MRLGRLFGTSTEMWANLQTRYDMEVAADALTETVNREVAPLQVAS
jgi:plasmid maintenance system antidote protein VapI